MEEISIPASVTPPPPVGEERVRISELDQIAQLAFRGIKTLNRIQSVVFDAAYNTNENLLISAPTGAGKTNIAMLAVLKEIRRNMEGGVIQKDKFKVQLSTTLMTHCIHTWDSPPSTPPTPHTHSPVHAHTQIIYVAPMKALAAEMVANFGSRLQPLGITVRELTGDMQLTKREITNTQVTNFHKFSPNSGKISTVPLCL